MKPSKRIEDIFGWVETIGGFRKSRYRDVERSHAQGQYVVAVWILVRMAKTHSHGATELGADVTATGFTVCLHTVNTPP